MNARRENQISWMLLLGVAGFFGGGFVFLIGMVLKAIPLMAMGPILILGGLCLAGYGVFSGMSFNKKASTGGVRMMSECYVVARFAVNQIGEMIFDNFEFDAPGARYYVRLKMPDGRDEEFECAHDLVMQVGEGMIGNVQVNGHWLGSFIPVPRR